MGEEQVVGVRRRRSRAQAEELVAEYEASGLSRSEFCRTHGLALATLNRYRKRRRARNEAPGGGGWLAVELADGNTAAERTGVGLAVVLASGRRIEVGRGFDANTLAQLLRVLERA